MTMLTGSSCIKDDFTPWDAKKPDSHFDGTGG